MTATQNALYASDLYLIPMQPDYLSTLGLTLLRDRLTYLKGELEIRISCLGVVFTRARSWIRYHAETMERLRTEPGFRRLHFFETVIPENIKLAEAGVATQCSPLSIRQTGTASSRRE
jgi:chromosome partitioning protein